MTPSPNSKILSVDFIKVGKIKAIMRMVPEIDERYRKPFNELRRQLRVKDCGTYEYLEGALPEDRDWGDHDG